MLHIWTEIMAVTVVVDFAHHFVKVTYQLEGKAFQAFHIISALTIAIEQQSFPNLDAITRELCPGNEAGQLQLKKYGQQCIEPSIVSYKERLVSSMKTPL